MARQLIKEIKRKIFKQAMDKKEQIDDQDILDPQEGQIESAPSDQEELETIANYQIEINELKDKYLRLVAEFDNYKKRTLKESLDLRKTAAQDTITVLLPVLDDFERAKKLSDEGKEGEVFSEGVQLVYQKLNNALATKGLKVMETNGEIFDPEQHEALTEIPAPTEELKGKIVDTIERGYSLHDKIIRYAKVVVGK